MSETKKRNAHLRVFKVKVGLGAVRGLKTVHQIAQEFGVHAVQAGQCVLAGVVRGTVYAQRKPKSPDASIAIPKCSTAIRARSSLARRLRSGNQDRE